MLDIRNLKLHTAALAFTTMAALPLSLNHEEEIPLVTNDPIANAEDLTLSTPVNRKDHATQSNNQEEIAALLGTLIERLHAPPPPTLSKTEQTYKDKINTLEFDFALTDREDEALKGCIAGTFAHNADKVALFNNRGLNIDLPLNHLVFDKNILSDIDAFGLEINTDIFFTYQYLEEYGTFVTDLFVELLVTDKESNRVGNISHAFHLLPGTDGIEGEHADFIFPAVDPDFPDDDLNSYILESVNTDISEYLKLYLESHVQRFTKCHYDEDLTKVNEAIEGMYSYDTPEVPSPK